MGINYLCISWKALLEQIVNLCGNGYYYVNISYLPVRKKEKFKEIDKKIIQKYKLEKDTKDKRYQRKKKGLANFAYLRWEHIIVIMHTEGDIIIPSELENRLKRKGKFKNKSLKTEKQSLSKFSKKQVDLYKVEADDDFTDLHKSPVFLKISDQVVFDIRFLNKKGISKETVTVRMSKEMFRNKKVELAELIEKKAKNRLIYSFNLMNHIPAWRGIIEQKVTLQHFVIRLAKKHHFNIEYKDLFVYMQRKKEEIIFVKGDKH